MQGYEIQAVLKDIGVTHLHHANSVITSCTFLEQGGLLSRGFVERKNLAQTPQSSDEIDKRYNIWEYIFLDHIDIHERAGRKKGPNQYGPALFRFDLDILLDLPPGTEVCVTKMNPIHWQAGQLHSDRWFQSLQELASQIRYGDFDKILVIKMSTGKLDFPDRQANIILDDPQRQISSGIAAYAHAEGRLMTAAKMGGVTTTIEKRKCSASCICLQTYASRTPHEMDTFFG